MRAWDVAALALVGIGAYLLIVPVLSSSRESAKSPNCRSHLKQLGTALRIYSIDYGDRYPSFQGESGEALPFLLFPYLKSTSKWKCPQDRRWAADYDGSRTDTEVSYGYNWLGLAPKGRGLPLRSLPSPEATVLFVDSSSSRATPSALLGQYPGTPPEYRHQRGAHVCWADGHVSYVDAQVEATSTQEKGKPLGSGIDAYLDWNRR